MSHDIQDANPASVLHGVMEINLAQTPRWMNVEQIQGRHTRHLCCVSCLASFQAPQASSQAPGTCVVWCYGNQCKAPNQAPVLCAMPGVIPSPRCLWCCGPLNIAGKRTIACFTCGRCVWNAGHLKYCICQCSVYIVTWKARSASSTFARVWICDVISRSRYAIDDLRPHVHYQSIIGVSGNHRSCISFSINLMHRLNVSKESFRTCCWWSGRSRIIKHTLNCNFILDHQLHGGCGWQLQQKYMSRLSHKETDVLSLRKRPHFSALSPALDAQSREMRFSEADITLLSEVSRRRRKSFVISQQLTGRSPHPLPRCLSTQQK